MIHLYLYDNHHKNQKLQTAYQFQKNNNFVAAKKIYTEFIKSDPDDPEFYLERANCEISLSEPEKAMADCEKAIEINTENGKAYYYYAYALYNNAKYDEACKAIKKAAKLGYIENTENICDPFVAP